jgi:hypothetical protein
MEITKYRITLDGKTIQDGFVEIGDAMVFLENFLDKNLKFNIETYPPKTPTMEEIDGHKTPYITKNLLLD